MGFYMYNKLPLLHANYCKDANTELLYLSQMTYFFHSLVVLSDGWDQHQVMALSRHEETLSREFVRLAFPFSNYTKIKTIMIITHTMTMITTLYEHPAFY